MKQAKRKRLEATGWRVGSATEFLGLSAEEAALVELRVALSESLRARRRAARLTQVALARQLGSSQSRVAKMEAGDPSVSLDLLLRSLLSLGAKPRDIPKAIERKKVAVAVSRICAYAPGTFRFKHRLLCIANALKQHHIGLEEVDDGIWSIYFNRVLLARLDERDCIIRD
jgi:transcriptional regulator with XRE-family HTH domain